jgi:hypothetical protein
MRCITTGLSIQYQGAWLSADLYVNVGNTLVARCMPFKHQEPTYTRQLVLEEVNETFVDEQGVVKGIEQLHFDVSQCTMNAELEEYVAKNDSFLILHYRHIHGLGG